MIHHFAFLYVPDYFDIYIYIYIYIFDVATGLAILFSDVSSQNLGVTSDLGQNG